MPKAALISRLGHALGAGGFRTGVGGRAYAAQTFIANSSCPKPGPSCIRDATASADRCFPDLTRRFASTAICKKSSRCSMRPRGDAGIEAGGALGLRREFSLLFISSRTLPHASADRRDFYGPPPRGAPRIVANALHRHGTKIAPTSACAVLETSPRCVSPKFSVRKLHFVRLADEGVRPWRTGARSLVNRNPISRSHRIRRP